MFYLFGSWPRNKLPTVLLSIPAGIVTVFISTRVIGYRAGQTANVRACATKLDGLIRTLRTNKFASLISNVPATVLIKQNSVFCFISLMATSTPFMKYLLWLNMSQCRWPYNSKITLFSVRRLRNKKPTLRAWSVSVLHPYVLQCLCTTYLFANVCFLPHIRSSKAFQYSSCSHNVN